LSDADLRAMPSWRCVATLRRQQRGIPGCARAWLVRELGAVGNVQWTGVLQPNGHDPNFGSYVIDRPLPIEVFVGAPWNWLALETSPVPFVSPANAPILR
jgi:hypothetical protein